MSLKAFHVLFIIASTLLTVAFGIWGIRQYSAAGDVQSLALGISSLIIAVALIVYGKSFPPKTETHQLPMNGIGFILACAACFGKSDSALAQGMNMGILCLLAVIALVLSCVAGFFIFLARQSARAAAMPGAAEIQEKHFPLNHD